MEDQYVNEIAMLFCPGGDYVSNSLFKIQECTHGSDKTILGKRKGTIPYHQREF